MTSLAEIMGCFESLGDNCEFGIAQRCVGIEPLGLLRLGSCRLPALLRALERDFAGIGAGGLSLLVEANQEYRVEITEYGFRYHTDVLVGQMPPEALLAQHGRVTRFLADKLRADLAASEKIFVRKGEDSATEADILPLHAALRARGPNTLLWVVAEDATHGAGCVEVLRPGLLKGYIDRLPPTARALQLSPVWLDICRAAHALWRAGAAPGTQAGPETPPASNLVLFAEHCGGPRWQAGPGVGAPVTGGSAPPPLFAGCAVVALEAPAVLRHAPPLRPIIGESYVASAHVWLPDGPAAGGAQLICQGIGPMRMAAADAARRAQWQRICCIGRADAAPELALHAVGPPGAPVFTTAWQLQRGAAPRPFTPGVLRPPG